MWLLVILPGAVWNCNAYKYFPFCMCYYINRDLCLGLNEHIFVSAWALPVWRCTRQIQSSDLLWPNSSNETLVKNNYYYLFQKPSPCSIFGMFLWCFSLSVNDLSSSSSFFYRFLINLPLAQILACSLDVFGHLLMICLFFPVYSNLCYIYYFFLHRKISGVLFLSPWLVSIRC